MSNSNMNGGSERAKLLKWLRMKVMSQKKPQAGWIDLE